MVRPRFHSSRPDHWNVPRPKQDANQRLSVHGPVLPMEDKPKGWLRRLFRRT